MVDCSCLWLEVAVINEVRVVKAFFFYLIPAGIAFFPDFTEHFRQRFCLARQRFLSLKDGFRVWLLLCALIVIIHVHGFGDLFVKLLDSLV